MTLKLVPQEHLEVPDVIDVEGIQKLIPHRYPMLLIERVQNIIPGERAVGYKNVSINEGFFAGHFPGKPVMPGVLIIEALAQTAAVLVTFTEKFSSDNKLVYFMGINEARFRKPVLPGDTLRLEVQKLQKRANVWKFTGKAFVGETLHAEATFMAMLAERE